MHSAADSNSRTSSLKTSPGKSAVITKEEFLSLDPSEIEIFVVRPVKNIVKVLSHVVSLDQS